MDDSRPAKRLASSTLVVGVVSVFLLAVSLIGLADETSLPLGASWSLRGTLIPAAEASASKLVRPALQGSKNPV